MRRLTVERSHFTTLTDLALVGTVLAAVWVGVRPIRNAAEAVVDSFRPTIAAAPNPYGNAEAIFPSPLVIREGVNIRAYPGIPVQAALRLPGVIYDNRIRWQDIDKVNGVSLNNAPLFVMEYAPVVEGEDTYKRGYQSSHDQWIRLKIQPKGEKFSLDYFINRSLQTMNVVTDLGPDYSFARKYAVNPAAIQIDKGPMLGFTDVGRVIYTGNETGLKSIWEDRTRKQLNGELPVTGTYAKRYEQVIVVPSGSTFNRIVAMREQNGRVKIKDYPGVTQPDGRPVNVLGTVALDTTIDNALLVDYGWGVFYAGNIKGELLDGEGKKVELPAESIVAVDSEFILNSASPRLQGGGDYPFSPIKN